METTDTTTPWHSISMESMCEKLETRVGGLTSEEAAAALAKWGPNALEKPKQRWLITKFTLNCLSPFALMLELAALLCFIIVGVETAGPDGKLDGQTLALAICLVVVTWLTAAFQTMMEHKADGLMEALKALTADHAFAYRDGELKKIPAIDLVPGDVVKVTAGEKVPADMRILQSTGLKVNNSSLTGEPIDISLGPNPVRESIFEALNIARSGCSFTMGSGEGMIFSTGPRTFFGEIARSAVQAKRPDTLMRQEIKRLVLVMGVIGTITGFSFFAAAFGLKYGWIVAFVTLVGLFVANIPEGLLPQITLALAITARRMKDEGVLVSSLEIIETLGAVSVICSDKTGTITLNLMSVVHLFYNRSLHVTERTPLLPGDVPRSINKEDPAMKAMMRVVANCSDAGFLGKPIDKPVGDWATKGDASESGLIKYHQEYIGDLDEARQLCASLGVMPFTSANKYMVSVCRTEPGKHVLLMKGAAERVLSRCQYYMDGEGKDVPLKPETIDEVNAQIDNLASRGERVLGFAQHWVKTDGKDDRLYDFSAGLGEFEQVPLTFVGLMALADPARASVKPAVEACREASIMVVMITGDHPKTAVSIARATNIITLPLISEADTSKGKPDPLTHSAVVTGTDMEAYTESDWEYVIQCKELCFARTQPQQKQEIVRRFQKLGKIVAMTGDGVNDAPALKAANIGVAVQSGTQVAKESAHLIIPDDFACILVGVKEGRQIFDNLKKAVVFVISHLLPEILPFVFQFALKIPLAMETIAILLVDLGSDLPPSVALAYEACEDRVMKIPPRSRTDHLIKANMLFLAYVVAGSIETFFGYWSYLTTFYDYGFTLQSIMGADTGFEGTWNALDGDKQQFYQDLCMNTNKYVQSVSLTGNSLAACGSPAAMNAFLSYFKDVVEQARAGYFITFAVMQLGYCLCYRHQVWSLFHRKQEVNVRLLIAVVFAVGFIIFVTHVPGLNAAFGFAMPTHGNAASGLWGLFVILIVEESRKWWCRTWPNGRFAKLCVY